MTKQLPTTGIANELKGSSVFFQAPSQPEEPQASLVAEPKQVSAQDEAVAETKAQVTPRNRDTAVSRNHATTATTENDTTPTAMLDEIRQVVKQLGKEAATHRFTAREKADLADIVYTYGRQGVKTSENEITRIAVNWLLLDYQERGAHSVLARMLERLHG